MQMKKKRKKNKLIPTVRYLKNRNREIRFDTFVHLHIKKILETIV